jgi:hypothetical protein
MAVVIIEGRVFQKAGDNATPNYPSLARREQDRRAFKGD